VQGRAADNPDLALVREKYGALFREALGVAIAALDPEDRELVRRVVEGVSPTNLGEAIGVHRTTAMRRFDRARLAIRDGLKRELVQRLEIDRIAADSLLRLYDTGFQLRLDEILEDA
jgi:DNA-directed RNA polymerase specialized sigma24 family protein